MQLLTAKEQVDFPSLDRTSCLSSRFYIFMGIVSSLRAYLFLLAVIFTANEGTFASFSIIGH